MMKKGTSLIIATVFSVFLGTGLALGQPTIDGVSDEANYTTLASYTSGNDGFGSTNNIDELNFYVDGNDIYIGVPGDLDSNNNIVIWLNFSGYDGQDAGNVIGESGETGIFGTGGFDGAKLDFEVDFGFAFNEGGGTSNLFLDAARYGNTGIIFESGFVGQSDQSGNSVSIPSSEISNLFDANTIELAYNNSGGSDEGIEFKIDIGNLPGVDSTQTVQIFVAIASSGGFMSNEFIPSGSYTGGNLGDDADVGGLTGDYFTSAELLQHNVEITGNAGWRLLSLPKTGGAVQDVSDDSPVQGVTGGDDTGADANFIIYDSDATFEQPTNVSTAWGDGLGFGLYFFDNTTNGSSELPVTLDASGSEPSTNVDVTLNPAASGYTLVGNPFASNYNTNSITATSSNISNTIAFWNDGTSSYSTQDRTDPYIIAPWQGFWVQTVSASATTLTFPTSGKTSTSTSGTFFSKQNANKGDIKFTFSSENSFDEALRLSFRENATTGYDKDDFGKLIPLTSNYATMAFKSNDLLKSVESLPWNLEEEINLALEEQLVGVSGEFTLDWKGIESIPADWNLTFHDYETGSQIDMRAIGQYVFTAEASSSQKVNPLTILDGPAAVTQKSKSTGNRFGITITPSTSVSNEPTDKPITFGLEQNYPNPFNPSTTIKYSVGEAGPVSITVYNVMGQKVAELLNTTRSAGEYQVTWNADNQASGIYYYRLTAPGQVITRQMTLIK